MRRDCLATGLLSILTPLVFIVVSASLSKWFNLLDNALSDLGHALRSGVAWIFNLGLATGGVLVIVYSLVYTKGFSKLLSALLVFLGYLLVLIAVFDEIYGFIHFAVSVLFFAVLLAFVILYSMATLRNKNVKVLAFILILLNLITWIAHFAYKTPRGAALPELISILTALPFYTHLVYKTSKTAKATS